MIVQKAQSGVDEELRKLAAKGIDVKPPFAWQKSFGSAKDDPLFEEALRMGQQYRRTGKIEGDDNADS
jgi:hypothetical protein